MQINTTHAFHDGTLRHDLSPESRHHRRSALRRSLSVRRRTEDRQILLHGAAQLSCRNGSNKYNYSPSPPLIRRRSCTSFRLPDKWQVRSDRPFCRSLGNGQAATLLQSNILLKTCRYRDKIFAYYCCAVPVPFQRLFISFLAVLGIAKQDTHKSLRYHFRGRSTRLRAVMYDKRAIAALPKNGSNPSVVRRTI